MLRSKFLRVLKRGKILEQLSALRLVREDTRFVEQNLELLLPLLGHAFPMVRLEAEFCLGFAAQSSSTIVNRLLLELASADNQSRIGIVHALGYVGLDREIEAGEPVPEALHRTIGERLVVLLDEKPEDPNLTFRLLQSIARLEHPGWQSILAEYLNDTRTVSSAATGTVQGEVKHLLS